LAAPSERPFYWSSAVLSSRYVYPYRCGGYEKALSSLLSGVQFQLNSHHARNTEENFLKTNTTLLPALLTLATILTSGCGDSHSVPPFKQLVFYSTRIVSPTTNIFTSKLDGTGITPVPGGDNAYYMSVSADSKKVAFYESGNAWVQNADGTGLVQLTNDSETNFVKVSPDGKLVMYEEYNDDHLHVINSDGTGDRDLTPTLPAGMTECYSGAFSADNTRITFVCSGSSIYGIYTIKADGTGIATVTATRSDWTDLSQFSPDGKKIFFIGFDNTNSVYDVESINLDGSGGASIVADTYEAVIENSTLYYTFFSVPLNHNQVYKANLDGTNAVAITDGVQDDYLALAQ
jgi:WD40 repeat protein